ncbi:MAG TPA: hypothetical protein VMF50_06785 [Candidatus Binataceae bacterium]|nr:hypothetical protein [Candidatus Binataceae bacterium]
MSTLGYENRAGIGGGLHTRGDIRRIAEHVGLQAGAHSDHYGA